MEHAHATQSFIGFEPHGHCFLWQPDLIALHTVSDFLTGLSYYAIPVAIFYFVRKRSDLPFPAMFILFALFIISCGSTHFMSIWTIWQPDYWLEGWVKAATAFFSLLTAVLLFPLLPKAMRIPSPAQLEAANRNLESEVAYRREAEAELQRHKDHLEELVQERTSELRAVNLRLESEVAERRAAEEALKQSEERYREFIEGTDNVVTQVDAGGRFTYVNQVAGSLMGLGRDEYPGRLAFDFVHPEDRQRTRDAFMEWTGCKLEKVTFENRLMAANGEARTLVWNIHLHYKDEEVSYINSIAQDITDISRAEDELRESRKFLEEVIDNIPDPVFVKDETHHYILANTALCVLAGRPREQVIGKTDRDFLPEVYADMFVSRDKMVLETGRMDISEESLTDPGGQVLSLFTKKNRYISAKGQRYVVGVIRDITERRRMQELMIQTEKMMSIGGLAAGMAHEINNPLSAVLQSIQVVQNRLIKETPANLLAAEQAGCSFGHVKEFLETREVYALLQGVRDAGVRAARIVSSMLEFSRRSEGDRAPVDLNALLDKAIDLCSNDYDLKKKYDFRKIAIERFYDERLPLVPCTATQIEQVLLNLLRNAAQAMFVSGQSSPMSITLKTSREGDMARIEVRDSGPGMPEEVRKRIFEPFYTTKGAGQGTGLGLSVSYFIITDNHKGSIEVKSRPGEGACFIILLPLTSREEPASEQVTA